jgi:para-aminobenzoate synthetase component 1
MYKKGIFGLVGCENFRKKIVAWLKEFDTFCLLDSNSTKVAHHNFSYSGYDFIVAAGKSSEISSTKNHTLAGLDEAMALKNKWWLGFLTYDLKNQFENLHSDNIDMLCWPEFYFFSPAVLLLVKNQTLEIRTFQNAIVSPETIWSQIQNINIEAATSQFKNTPLIKPRISKEEYLKKIKLIKDRIHRGDLYEINFCQEFYTQTQFDPFLGWQNLSEISPAPFASFFRLKNKYLLSASPERFMKKLGQKLISQPIKGTARRNKDAETDSRLMETLKESKKERSENIMIVDLVRNDLSRISIKDSVKVDELCGIYSFSQVHQMISTISSQTKTNSIKEILKATFPMGSMTGAPKIRAMELAEEFETTKRGLYSGAVGYITPDGDFDFNVVIRSLQYNAENEYLSYMVGGAITSLSDPEKEYDECLVKASALEQVLKNE